MATRIRKSFRGTMNACGGSTIVPTWSITMSTKLMASAAFASILAMSASSAFAAKSPQDFINSAIQGDDSEIALGQLAQQKAGNEQVRQFGQALVTDHAQAKDQAASVAKTLGVTPTDKPTQEAQDEQSKLSKLSGNEFDQEFANYMATDHQKDIREFQDEADANDGPASDLAKKQLPALRRHLQMAEAIVANGDKSAATTTGAKLADTAVAPATHAALTAPQDASNTWRASKLVGVAIYGTDNKKVGNITDIMMSKDGKAELVIVGVGGFLGLGEKDVAIPFDQVKFTSQLEETRAAATANEGGSTTVGANGNKTMASNAGGTGSAMTSSGHDAYPDHGMIEMTAAQLKSAPTFQFAK